MKEHQKLPLVLKVRQKVTDESFPEGEYNPKEDLWLTPEGLPMVLQIIPGRTLITATGEGIDQPEHYEILRTRFGETISTRTREGIDQPEHYELETAVDGWGRTLITKTREGIDSTEVLELV
ncbi:hypothetical protein MTBGP_06930 [Moorella thermoacetica]|uniref:hypothetical protein n=1 Tax=Neomoorella thermoacetica TaxID=1525 RepID=UPI0030D34ABF